MSRDSRRRSGKRRAGCISPTTGLNRAPFPTATCDWIQSLGKVPYLRLMLRSDLDQYHAEKVFSLTNICAGRFDDDLRRWAAGARNFSASDPDRMGDGAKRRMVFLEWEVERSRHRTGSLCRAYRHIFDLMRAAGANNLQWVWHVNWDDDPEKRWNRLENYFPGR